MRRTSMVVQLSLYAVILTIFYPAYLHSETEVSGNVSGEWTAEGNPYIVTDNITIAQGATLVISPGVSVLFERGNNLTVNGLLLAEGTRHDSLEFTGLDGASWSGIRFTNASDDNSSISYAKISEGSRPGNWEDPNARGGALKIESCNPTISHCSFWHNTAGGLGGTMFIGAGANPNISHCKISQSVSIFSAIDILFSSATIDHLDVSECEGSMGVALAILASQNVAISNCRFVNNVYNGYTGAGIYMADDASASVRNCVIANNQGGAVFIDHGSRIDPFDHNTVANNQMGGERGAIETVWESHIVITNSIIWGNAKAFTDEENSITISYSDVQNRQGVNLGQGCIEIDPLFVNPDEYDYRLRENSPCIDAGNPNAERDPDGSRADMGWIPPYSIDLTANPSVIDFGAIGVENLITTNVSILYTSNSDIAPDIDLRFLPDEDNDWLVVEPAQASLSLDDSIALELTINFPDGFDLGPVEGEVRVYIDDDADVSLAIPVSIDVVRGRGVLCGVVTDLLSDRPLEGIVVELKGAFRSTVTNFDGEYRFDPIFPWQYVIAIDAESYQPYESDVIEIEDGDESVQNISLRFSDCQGVPGSMTLSVPPGESRHFPVYLRNSGSGESRFRARACIPSLDAFGLFDERMVVEIEDITEDTRIQSVAYAEGRIYVSGGNSGDGRGKIYVFDPEGNYEGSFDQFINSNYGMKDLTWDGELLWGVDDRIFYGFTTDGELVRTIETPINSGRCITFDPDRQEFWGSATTGYVYNFDRDGNLIQTIRNLGLRMYGMAWYPLDPDGSNLYFFLNEAERHLVVRKLNIETHEVVDVKVWNNPVFTPNSCEISNQWDPLSWVFMGILKSVDNGTGDKLAFYHLDGNTDWISVEPQEGIIPPLRSLELSLFIDATDLPENHLVEAEIAVESDGRSGNFAIPIEINVAAVEEEEVSQRTIFLKHGPNLISLNLEPEVDDIRQMFRPITDEGLVNFVKDQVGRFYWPDYNDFCSIPRWNCTEGYYVDVKHPCRLTFSGTTIPAYRPIPLKQGWQFAAYFPRRNSPAVIAFAGIEEDLILVKDIRGAFYSPSWGFSNMEDCSEGVGYKLLMRRNSDLYWNIEGLQGDAVTKPPRPVFYSVVPTTGRDMSLLITGCNGLSGEIGVYVGEKLVGSGVISGDFCGLAVRGKGEIRTSSNDAEPGEILTLKIRDGQSVEREIEVIMLEGDLKYLEDGFAVAQIIREAVADNFLMLEAFPNPFNSSTTISDSLPKPGRYALSVVDITGREVARLSDGWREAGSYREVWGGSNNSSGSYIVTLKSENRTTIEPITLCK